MKAFSSIVLTLTLCVIVYAATPEEIKILCSYPKDTIYQILNFLVQSDKDAEKFANILHECLSPHFQTSGRLDSYKKFLCHPEIKQNALVYLCLYDHREELRGIVRFRLKSGNDEHQASDDNIKNIWNNITF
ncbi:uncharacterized protein [Centruroides vittatus]|uniref:uncharacterized protein n=1 Tax=Centruroides vittatus TaxID=120091 RepID=UPI00350FF2AB